MVSPRWIEIYECAANRAIDGPQWLCCRISHLNHCQQRCLLKVLAPGGESAVAAFALFQHTRTLVSREFLVQLRGIAGVTGVCSLPTHACRTGTRVSCVISLCS